MNNQAVHAASALIMAVPGFLRPLMALQSVFTMHVAQSGRVGAPC